MAQDGLVVAVRRRPRAQTLPIDVAFTVQRPRTRTDSSGNGSGSIWMSQWVKNQPPAGGGTIHLGASSSDEDDSSFSSMDLYESAAALTQEEEEEVQELEEEEEDDVNSEMTPEYQDRDVFYPQQQLLRPEETEEPHQRRQGPLPALNMGFPQQPRRRNAIIIAAAGTEPPFALRDADAAAGDSFVHRRTAKKRRKIYFPSHRSVILYCGIAIYSLFNLSTFAGFWLQNYDTTPPPTADHYFSLYRTPGEIIHPPPYDEHKEGESVPRLDQNKNNMMMMRPIIAGSTTSTAAATITTNQFQFARKNTAPRPYYVRRAQQQQRQQQQHDQQRTLWNLVFHTFAIYAIAAWAYRRLHHHHHSPLSSQEPPQEQLSPKPQQIQQQQQRDAQMMIPRHVSRRNDNDDDDDDDDDSLVI
jgi:hypothetical protein